MAVRQTILVSITATSHQEGTAVFAYKVGWWYRSYQSGKYPANMLRFPGTWYCTCCTCTALVCRGRGRIVLAVDLQQIWNATVVSLREPSRTWPPEVTRIRTGQRSSKSNAARVASISRRGACPKWRMVVVFRAFSATTSVCATNHKMHDYKSCTRRRYSYRPESAESYAPWTVIGRLTRESERSRSAEIHVQ